MSHIRKRQFQPSANQASITSFFTRIDPANPPADFNPYDRKHVPAFSPPLPDPVQSQLMNMGMRIRKSVPEGYKTHKTMPPPSSAPVYTPRPTLQHSETAPASSAPSGLYEKPNELMPMCGLHKIGGYASQPVGPPSSMPELSYSQPTQPSTDSPFPSSTLHKAQDAPSTPTNTRKRSYADEIEDELDSIFSDEAEADRDSDSAGPARSPKSKYPFSHSSMPELNRKSGFVRPGSRPKARMRGKATAVVDTADVKDFEDEDVAFLVPMDCD